MVKNAAQASKAGPGLYSWPFSFQLDPDMPETVPRLLDEAYIRYSLVAEVSTGVLTKSLSTCERIRIIKSPSFWADQLFIAPEVSDQLSRRSKFKRPNASYLADPPHNDPFYADLSHISSTTLPACRWGTRSRFRTDNVFQRPPQAASHQSRAVPDDTTHCFQGRHTVPHDQKDGRHHIYDDATGGYNLYKCEDWNTR